MSTFTEDRLSTTDFVATGDRAEPSEQERTDQNTPKPEEAGGGPLLPQNSAQDLRNEWDGIQTSFVDDPRTSVKKADELVENAMKRLSETFTQQRSNLERQWDRGEDVSTEDLRLALQKYRSF